MDPEQVRALRHKRHIIATNIELNEDAVTAMTHKKLINKALLDNMKEEIANVCRVVKYLELIEDCPNGIAKGLFDRLCDYLEGLHPWLTDELRTELRTIRGELKIDGYVQYEATEMTNVEFGPIRRLTVKEKLDIGSLAAVRMQHYKEMWTRPIAVSTQQLEEMLRIIAQKDEQQSRQLEKIQSFLRVHEKVLQSESDGSSKIYSPADDNEEEQMLISRLGTYVGGLRDMGNDTLQNRKLVRDEKQRALRVIGVSDINSKLDREVNRTLDPIDQELERLTATLNELKANNDKMQAQLTAIGDDLKSRLLAGDDKIRQLSERILEAGHRTRDLRAEMHELQQQLVETKRLLAKYQTKSRIMDSTRNLGYVNKDQVVVGKKTGDGTMAAPAAAAQRLARPRASIFDVSYNGAVGAGAGPGGLEMRRSMTRVNTGRGDFGRSSTLLAPTTRSSYDFRH